MDTKTYQSLLAEFPKYTEKIHMFAKIIGKDKDIEDPFHKNSRNEYERILNQIKTTIEKGFPKLLKLTDEHITNIDIIRDINETHLKER